MSRVTVRDAADADLPAIQAIYAHHVLHGLASFEEEPPTVEEIGARRANVLRLGLPYLAAELEGEVVGYSYAGTYRPRPAYRFTVENSVYVRDGLAGRGVGKALLVELIARCEAGPWQQMLAVIGNRENRASIALASQLRLSNDRDPRGGRTQAWPLGRHGPDAARARAADVKSLPRRTRRMRYR